MMIVVMMYKDHGVDTEIERKSFSGIMLTVCGIALYMIQIGILYFGVVIFTRIRNLPSQKPLCPDNICSLDNSEQDHQASSDKELCQKCNHLQSQLKKRLPTITRTIVFFFIL